MRVQAIILILMMNLPLALAAQNSETSKQWSLTDCINYALDQNIQVRQSILTNLSNEVSKEQAVAQKLPSLSASARQNFSWAKKDDINGESSFDGNNSTSYGLSSSVTLYNGQRLNNLIKQAELDMQTGIFNSETIKESISLSILNAFLQVLYADENVQNAEKQLEATTEQLGLSEARLESGIISRSDYLQVKSQLATEKLSLANAKSQFAIAKVNLMQLMELPVDENFAIARPKLKEDVNENLEPSSTDVYALALAVKPQVRSSEYQKESAALNEKIAKAAFYPTISADAGLSTGYSNQLSSGYASQISDQIMPTVGVSVAIPIFQKKQVKSSVSQAKINYQNAELNEINTKNELRKSIEQACLDVTTAQIEYEASMEQYQSNLESYAVAEEKFDNGLINSVDFLFEKTNLIVAESSLLQSKYNLIFSYRILDFYKGKPITL
ncbi:TolC family protein [Maribellus sp. YY47]|uniref:TolC family protein n=1 Tax=Maribellus sp. YY47 TaxID=2929486 RepID=UPI002000FD10|nr:TolC family protein [Maribellus sp. YY47]MCK3684824.1 TolC family protein [Maribellus sp. YY47]